MEPYTTETSIELDTLKEIQKYFESGKAEDENNFLHHAFERTKYYDIAISEQFPLIIGRKGSGKSAIVRVIERWEKGNFADILVLTSEDFNYPGLVNFYNRAKQCEGFEQRFHLKYTWRHVVLTSVMLQLVRKAEKAGELSDDLKGMKDALRRMGIAELPRFLDVSNRILGLFEDVVKVSSAKFHDFIRNVFFSKDFEDGVECLKKYLRASKPFVVFIDGLDKELERYVADPEIIFFFIRALVETVLELHQDPSFRERLILKAFIPTDIYNKVKVDIRDIDTVRLHVEEIQWDDKKLYELLCKRLIVAMRIKRHGEYSQDYDYAWHRVFPSKVHTRPSYKSSELRTTFDYLVEHTLHRPRDLIVLCNFIFRLAQERVQDEKAKIDSDIVNDAIERFTAETPEVVCLEYNYRRPNVKNLIMHFQGKDQSQFTYDTFEKIVEQYLVENELTWHPYEVIRDLYEMGFIGAIYIREDPINPKMKHASEYYSYSEPSMSINLAAADFIKIHHLFHNFLLLHD